MEHRNISAENRWKMKLTYKKTNQKLRKMWKSAKVGILCKSAKLLICLNQGDQTEHAGDGERAGDGPRSSSLPCRGKPH